MQPFSLVNKTVLVTGASSGIGRQTAILLAALGAKVIVHGRDSTRLQETFNTLAKGEHEQIQADISLTEHLPDLVNQLPPLNGLVHCAGIWKPGPVKFLQEKLLHQIMQINYIAPVLLIGQLLQQHKIVAGASLVFISSVAAQHPYKGGAAYAASKAALEAFCKTLALECAHQRIRANCIAPAMVKTPLFIQTQNMVSEQYMQQHEQAYPLRTGLSEDVANAAAYLLSEASGWITGTVLRLDGGLTIGS